MDGPRIALVGATGAVGKVFLGILEEGRFPVGEVRLCASERSVGKEVALNGHRLTVEAPSPELFSEVDIVFIAAGSGISRELAPMAAEGGRLRSGQEFGLPHGPRRAAGRARGKRRRPGRPQRHRLRAELLHNAVRDGPQAAKRRRSDLPRRRRHLPIGLRDRRRSHGRAHGTERPGARTETRQARRSIPTGSRSTSCRRSSRSSRTATRRRR